MTEAAAPPTEPAPGRADSVLPFRDRSRVRRIAKVLAWLIGIGVLVLILNLLGVDVSGWFSEMWDTLTAISFGYLLAGWLFQTLQTTLTAVGWYFILRAGFPQGFPTYLQVLAAYAAGVALNGFLPANIGTFVTLLMFVAIIPHANLPGILGAMVVQKIFFTVIGTLVYLYLFLSVPGSFELQLGQPHDHPWLTALIILGGGFLLVVLCRVFWKKLKGLWESAKQGGVILSRPRDYVVQVLLPSIGAWLSKLAVIAVFLAAYEIPVTFHSVMSVVGGNQAVNVAALKDYADPATATAYSLGQQLAVTFWNIAFGIVLVVWAFGWTGGKLLVQQSYVDAKATVAEQKAQRAAKKEAKKAAEAEAD